jgi:PAS domain S-box-containing protein
VLEALLRFFGPGAFMPHGMCYLWNPALLRLHLVSDLLIGSAYFVISLTLLFFVRNAKRDIPFSWIFLGFGTFIIACGLTHFMDIWTLWVPVYWLSGMVKLLTAAASVTVAIVLPPLLPKSLALIRAANLSEVRRNELEIANQALGIEVADRRNAERTIHELNAELADRVRSRTLELAHVREDLARLTDSVGQSDEPVTIIDPHGRISGWNHAAELFYGYSKDELIGQLHSVLVPSGKQADWAQLLARIAVGEHVIGFETMRTRKNGEVIYVSTSLTPIRNSAGVILGATILDHDITERRRAQEMFRIAVEAAPNAMLMVDAQELIVLANAQTEALFGYTRDELIGASVEMLVPQMGSRPDLHGVRKDGAEFPVEVGLNSIESDHGLLVLSAIIDITERKRAQEEIRLLNESLELRVQERTLQLAAANQELEAFSYSVAHDLRGPLRSIDGFSQALLEDYGEALDVQGKDYVRRVLGAAHRMSLLIDDLLSLSRVTRSELHKQRINLSALANAVADELREKEPQRNVDFVIEDDLFVSGDSRLLRVVMENLLGNAWKYTGRHDRSRIEFGGTQDSRGLPACFVRDDGAGFDPLYATRLFGAFQRMHTTAEFPGNGAGLATVQRIVHRHGGEVWAEAAVEKGATFFFTLSSEEAKNDTTD